jgi:hypothetical protein
MADDSYKIGYRKPPLETRFKPGCSGNPRGRPRKVHDLADDVRRELNSLVSDESSGEKRRLRLQRVLLRKLRTLALEEGHFGSLDLLLKLAREFSSKVTSADAATDLLDAALNRTLDAEVARRLAAENATIGPAKPEDGDDA